MLGLGRLLLDAENRTHFSARCADSFPRSGQGVNHDRVKFHRHMRRLAQAHDAATDRFCDQTDDKDIFFRSLIAVTAFLVAGRRPSAQSPQCQRFQAGTGGPGARRQPAARRPARCRPNGGDQPPRRLLPQDRLRARPSRLPRRAGAGRVRLDRPADPPARGRLVPASPGADPRPGQIDARRRPASGRGPADLLDRSAARLLRIVFGAPRQQQPAADHARRASRSSPMTDRPPRRRPPDLRQNCDGSFFRSPPLPAAARAPTRCASPSAPAPRPCAYAYPGRRRPAKNCNRAASLSSNQPYTSLANAFRSSCKSFDESCACKKSRTRAGPWSCARPSEACSQRKGRLDRHRREGGGDVASEGGSGRRKAADKKADEETRKPPRIAAAAPTASKDLGRYRPAIDRKQRGGRPGRGAQAGSRGGRRPEEDGRVIAPNLIPVPHAQMSRTAARAHHPGSGDARRPRNVSTTADALFPSPLWRGRPAGCGVVAGHLQR